MRWSMNRIMTLSISKSEAIFSSSSAKCWFLQQVHSDGNPLPFNTTSCLLGVTLDHTLSFIHHLSVLRRNTRCVSSPYSYRQPLSRLIDVRPGFLVKTVLAVVFALYDMRRLSAFIMILLATWLQQFVDLTEQLEGVSP